MASHTQHAVGVALAFKLRHEKRAAVCIFGDGATSKGDFYEAINVAGAWTLPVVFVVNNNQWAISVPRSRQTGARDARAEGHRGRDRRASRWTATTWSRSATQRSGRWSAPATAQGATLIEAVTYRLADHTTADDASRYRDPDAVKGEWQAEPLSRLRRYLTEAGAWNKDDEQRLQADCNRQVDEAIAAYLATPPQAPETIFDYHFAALPDELERQRAALLAETPAHA